MFKRVALLSVLTLSLSACSDNEVGDVSLGMFTTNDLHSITQPF